MVRFGTFEFDAASGELRKQGRRVPLQSQPALVLAQLLSRPASWSPARSCGARSGPTIRSSISTPP